MDKSIYWIWLADLFGHGTRHCQEVLDCFEHPLALFEAEEEALRISDVLNKREIAMVLAHDLSKAKKHYDDAVKIGCAILTPDHEDYPEKLANIYAKPCVLYVLGSIAGLDKRLAIGMVGSRKMSEYGGRVAHKLSYDLACGGAVIVSGMANGIDQVCHKAAIKAEGTTIGVLGCGIDIDYPSGSEPVKKLMIQKGALISEYPPGTQPFPGNFVTRNRIISGISNGVVVVEGGEHSGTLITAGHALTQGRDVFAVPGRIDDPLSQGTNKLLKQGARPITCAGDVADEYSYMDSFMANITKQQAPLSITNSKLVSESKPRAVAETAAKVQKSTKKPAPSYLNATQLRIYELLSQVPMAADYMATSLDLPITKVLGSLTELEIYGLAAACSGRSFTTCEN